MSGCATLSEKEPIFSIDTTKRGAAVTYLDGNKEITQTSPFFVKLKQSHKREFTITSDGVRTKETVECNFRWLPTIFGNSILLALGKLSISPFIFGTAVGIDFLTGAAWHCPSHILLTTPTKTAKLAASEKSVKETESCQQLLVLTPGANDAATAWEYEKEWNAHRKNNPGVCENIVTPTKADAILARLGLFDITPKSADRDARNQSLDVGMETGATHVLFISSSNTNDSQVFTAEKRDIHRWDIVEQHTWKRPLEPTEKNIKTQIARSARSLFLNFIPNSIGLSQTTSTAIILHKQILTSGTDQSYGILATNVRHPQQYKPWDFSADWIPNAAIQYMKLKIINPGQVDQDKISVLKTQASIGGRLTFHTPMGALSPSLSLGGIALASRSSDSNKTFSDAGSFSSLAFGIRGFATERVFMELNFANELPLNALKYSPDRQAQKTITAQFAMGYFLPEMSRWIGRKID